MSTLHTAEILAIGSELLTPFRQDTNSLFLTGRLNDCGIDVHWKSLVRDNRVDIAAAVRLACTRADIVIATGGLGPTADDLTREVVAEVLGLALEEDTEILNTIRARFEARGIPRPELNRRQAAVPRGARVLTNRVGTAPGLWIDARERVVVLLPGPPRELQSMFDEWAMPELRRRSGTRQVRRRVIATTGRSESAIDETAEPIYSTFTGPVPIETTILAAPGQIELHLSARGDDVAALDRALEAAVARLTAALGSVVISADGRVIEVIVGDRLRERGLRIAVAESCTGGLVLGRLTDVAGSSGWVVGGVVAYDNAVKVRELGVAEELLREHGAVSEPVARAMAIGIRVRLGAEVGVGVTGVAGPAGGSPEKPVGTVVIAVAAPAVELARTFLFPGDRATVRRQSVAAALNMVRLALG